MVREEDSLAFEEREGLNQGFLSLFTTWISHVLKGDLGKSFVDGKNINHLVLHAFSKTLLMAITAWTIYATLGTLIGMICGLYPKGLFSRLMEYWAVISVVTPVFWVALFVVWALSVKLQWLSTCGSRGYGAMVLPGALIGIIATGNLIVIVKEKTQSILREPFILGAEAMGLSRCRIMVVHVLKNILAPVVSLSALSLSNFLGYSVVMEQIFSIQGLGQLMGHAISIKDYMIVAASVLGLGLTVAIINALADILYMLLDRRGENEV